MILLETIVPLDVEIVITSTALGLAFTLHSLLREVVAAMAISPDAGSVDWQVQTRSKWSSPTCCRSAVKRRTGLLVQRDVSVTGNATKLAHELNPELFMVIRDVPLDLRMLRPVGLKQYHAVHTRYLQVVEKDGFPKLPALSADSIWSAPLIKDINSTHAMVVLIDYLGGLDIHMHMLAVDLGMALLRYMVGSFVIRG